MNTNVKVQEQIAVLATLDPAAVAAGTVVTGFVPVSGFNSFLALIQTGALGTAATVDAKLRQAKDSSGGSAKDITGKAITQIVKATGDNVQAMIECRDTDLDSTNGFNYVALSVTVGTATSTLGAALIGGNAKQLPASASNQAAVVQVV